MEGGGILYIEEFNRMPADVSYYTVYTPIRQLTEPSLPGIVKVNSFYAGYFRKSNQLLI